MTESDSRSKQSGEPSMDEILESIRRIVFEEDDRPRGSGAGVSDPDAPAAEVPAAGRAAGEETAQPAGTDTTPDKPPPVVEPLVEPLAEPLVEQLPGVEPATDEEAAGGVGAGPGETVLLLTDMIAPDGSVVRLDPRPADAAAGLGSGEGETESALDPATQSELAATVREWLDRNAPELVDRAARRELQKRSDRRD